LQKGTHRWAKLEGQRPAKKQQQQYKTVPNGPDSQTKIQKKRSATEKCSGDGGGGDGGDGGDGGVASGVGGGGGWAETQPLREGA
jgi:hypothetical protein